MEEMGEFDGVSSLGESKCALCGLPTVGSGVGETIGKRELRFCCLGCRAVYLVLFARLGEVPEDPTGTDLYQACVKADILPIGARPQGDQPRLSSPPSGGEMELHLGVRGLRCPSCCWILENILGRTHGILNATASFATDTLGIRYMPSFISPREILEKIRSLGYEPFVLGENDEERRCHRSSMVRLGISALLTAHVMMISWTLYMGFLEELSRQSVLFLSIPLWVLSTPVLFWCGLPLMRQALYGVKSLSPNLESLVSLGALSAYLYSCFQILKGSLHLYFDTSSMLVSLVLLGRFLESRAKASVVKNSAGSWELGAVKARLVAMEREKWVPSNDVREGQLVMVKQGEIVPVDGRIVKGKALADRSAITGESKPVRLIAGDEILAGSRLVGGEILLRASKSGRESILNTMASMVREAMDRPYSWDRLADRITKLFVPAVVGLAAGVIFWMWLVKGEPGEGLLRGLCVCLIACPCALGIATPLAKVAAIDLGRRRGIWIRDPQVLEGGGRIKAMLMDKTGTVTKGEFHLKTICSPDEDPNELLRKAASVELSSDHFLAQPIIFIAREKLLELEEPDGFQEKRGLGASGLLRGERVCVGNRDWLSRWGLIIPFELEEKAKGWEATGATVVFVGWNGRARGFLALGDTIRDGARQTIEALKEKSIQVWMVSGDGVKTTQAVAEDLGIERFAGALLPHQKAALVEKICKELGPVGFVGDGLNDAPSLALAQLGIALGSTVTTPGSAASVHVTRSDPKLVLEVLEICRQARRTVIQNLFFSLLYNISAIPAAMAGFLNPIAAVIAMFASSMTVIQNSRRLSKAKLGNWWH